MWRRWFKQGEVDRAQTLLGAHIGKPLTSNGLSDSATAYVHGFRWFEECCELAGLPATARRWVWIRILLVFSVSIALALAYRTYFISVLPIIWLGLEYIFLQHRIFLRAESFERDYPPFLVALASSIRTGLDPLDALIGAAVLFPANTVLAIEIGKTKRRIESGAQESEAISSLTEWTVARPA